MSDANELADDLAEIAADPMCKQYIRRTAESAASTLRANASRIKALEEALEPFAKLAAIFPEKEEVGDVIYEWTSDYEPFDRAFDGHRIVGITVGDLRRARAARSHPNV